MYQRLRCHSFEWAAASEFWAHVDAAALAESTTCMNAMLEKLPLKADKANVSLVAEMDATACFASDDLGLNVTSAPFRFAMWNSTVKPLVSWTTMQRFNANPKASRRLF